MVELIASTTTRTGLTVRCELDTRDCVTSPPLVVRFTSGSPSHVAGRLLCSCDVRRHRGGGCCDPRCPPAAWLNRLGSGSARRRPQHGRAARSTSTTRRRNRCWSELCQRPRWPTTGSKRRAWSYASTLEDGSGRAGADVALPRMPGRETCPVRALEVGLRRAGTRRDLLFRRMTATRTIEGRLTGDGVSRLCREGCLRRLAQIHSRGPSLALT